MAIDKSFVVTADSLEGYRIVKYLGTVCGSNIKKQISGADVREPFQANQYEMIQMAEELGANAIISERVLTRSDGYIMVFYGTAVIIEPISN